MAAPVFGITGPLASGKDYASVLMRSFGIAEIDDDRVGHLILDQKVAELTEAFGDLIISNDRINRPMLGELVFADENLLKKLNTIVHPPMVKMVRSFLDEITGPVVINAALLYQMGLHVFCDTVIYIWAPEEMLVKRAVDRGGLSREDVKKRLEQQKDINQIKESADVVIENVSSLEIFEKKITAFIQSFFGGTADAEQHLKQQQQQEANVYPQSG